MGQNKMQKDKALQAETASVKMQVKKKKDHNCYDCWEQYKGMVFSTLKQIIRPIPMKSPQLCNPKLATKTS